jgi:hypothetical protein
MYFWKCWRETRASFYVFLLIAIAFAVLHGRSWIMPWAI